MKNFDLGNKTMDEARQKLMSALKDDNEQEQQDAFLGIMDAIAEETKAEAQASIARANEGYQDEQILMNRGTHKPLTTQEKKYFNAVVEKGGFEDVEEVFPTTIVEDVLSNIEKEHPILSKVDLIPTKALMKYIYAKPNAQTAFWGDIRADIRQIILDGFKVANLESYKLSGFVVILKGMIELGPGWLATYVTRSLREIMSNSLELAVVDGEGPGATDDEGDAPQPVGMTKSLTGVVDGVHPDKTPVVLNDFEPASMAGLRAALAEAETDNGNVSVLVNPTTYWLKLFPNLATKVDNRWTLSNLPTGEEIIPSHAVPQDRLIYGNLKNYFLAVSGNVRINYYDQTLAIEDLDLYIAKFFGNGIPKDPNAFFVADISGVEGGTIAPLDSEEEEAPEGA
jgi:HK97 family phage major capsid protein